MSAVNEKKKKTEVLNLRITSDLHDAIKQVAKAHNQSKTEFVIRQLIEAVQKELQGRFYQHIEERDGKLFFKGRRLEVFQNYLFFSQSKLDVQEWADTYNLPTEAINEARLACEGSHSDAYLQWKEEFEKDDDGPLVTRA
ncbi:MAG: DUF1778 domain-containing protein [Oligoflexus sp.]